MPGDPFLDPVTGEIVTPNTPTAPTSQGYPTTTTQTIGNAQDLGYWEAQYDNYGRPILDASGKPVRTWHSIVSYTTPQGRQPSTYEDYGRNPTAYLAYLAATNPTAFQQYQQDPQAYARMQQSGRAPTEGQLLLAGGSKEAGIPGNPYLQQVLGLVGGGPGAGAGSPQQMTIPHHSQYAQMNGLSGDWLSNEAARRAYEQWATQGGNNGG